jgi:hypothetical protein
MTLKPCKECNKEISDKAPGCPHCGCPASDFIKVAPVLKTESSHPQWDEHLLYISNHPELDIDLANGQAKVESTKGNPSCLGVLLVITIAAAVFMEATQGFVSEFVNKNLVTKKVSEKNIGTSYDFSRKSSDWYCPAAGCDEEKNSWTDSACEYHTCVWVSRGMYARGETCELIAQVTHNGERLCGPHRYR